MISLGSGKENVPQNRKPLLLWSGLYVSSCPPPPPHHSTIAPPVTLPFWEPLCLFTLEDEGMLWCRPESWYCCFSASGGLPQGSKRRRKLGSSIPVFPPVDAPILSLWASVCCTRWNPGTTLLWRVSQSVCQFLRSVSILFLSMASPGLGLGERISTWYKFTVL